MTTCKTYGDNEYENLSITLDDGSVIIVVARQASYSGASMEYEVWHKSEYIPVVKK